MALLAAPGHLPEGRHWLESLLEATDDAASVPRVKALIGLAWTCYWLADLDEAAVRFRQALDLVERDDDFLLRAEALLGQIVTLACHRGQVQAAVPLERELQALAAQHQHPALMLLGHVASGTIRRFSGDLEGARTHALEGAAMTRAIGDRWWEGEALRALGQISYEQGRHDEADEHLRASLGIAWEIGHHTGVAIDLNWLGLVAIARGRPARGVVLAGAAAKSQHHGGPRDEGNQSCRYADEGILADRGRGRAGQTSTMASLASVARPDHA